MRNSFLYFAILTFFVLFSNNSLGSLKEVTEEFDEIYFVNEPINFIQDWYATTGTTRNTYGTNYSINIRVKGFAGYGGCVTISEVQVSNGYGWSTVSYYSVYGEDCSYYVSVDGKSYYFRV